MEEDLSNVEFETSEEVKCINSFDKMGLKDTLLRGIYAYGEFEFEFMKFTPELDLFASSRTELKRPFPLTQVSRSRRPSSSEPSFRSSREEM